jgi:CheY-like chemotaxis protein
MDTPSPFLVFVADDDRDTADTLRMLLDVWQIDNQAFYSGQEIWQAACSCRPSALLIDIAMPELDGFCLAKMVRQNPELKDILLIAVTGYADEAHRIAAMQAGFDIFLVKPTDLEQLRDLLTAAKEKRSSLSSDWKPAGELTQSMRLSPGERRLRTL